MATIMHHGAIHKWRDLQRYGEGPCCKSKAVKHKRKIFLTGFLVLLQFQIAHKRSLQKSTVRKKKEESCYFFFTLKF